ncbi:MAG TPA: transglutaminase-like domain-containing protein [Fibrobacteria bacterium]|nr:transglutaminase-like domain-containing protein [Fibrobacteria bacterium]
MAEDKDLVHILKLLDDESPRVRDRVWEKLEANLPAWEAGIRARLGGLPSGPRRKLMDLLSGRARKGFRSSWLRWRGFAGDMEKLEAALSGLSWYLAADRSRRERGTRADAPSFPDDREEEENHRENVDYRADFGPIEGSGSAEGTGEGRSGDPEGNLDMSPRHPELAAMLDGLALEFRLSGGPMRPTSLARFLFSEKGFKGAENDYYNPDNSDLVRVIEKGQGIPISLACVFMLVGHRLGFGISGCDVPEHFLTRASEEGKDVIIDCFDGGRVLEADRLALLERKYAPEFSRLLKSAASPEAIVARVLRNLINAYHLAGERQASQFMWSLAEDLRGEREEGGLPEGGE